MWNFFKSPGKFEKHPGIRKLTRNLSNHVVLNNAVLCYVLLSNNSFIIWFVLRVFLVVKVQFYGGFISQKHVSCFSLLWNKKKQVVFASGSNTNVPTNLSLVWLRKLNCYFFYLLKMHCILIIFLRCFSTIARDSNAR